MTTQNSEPSSVPTCRADDFYCAPIYDPSATAIFIQPASGEEDAALDQHPGGAVLHRVGVWVCGAGAALAHHVAKAREPARLAEDDLGTQRLDRDAFVTVVAIVGLVKVDESFAHWLLSSDYFCALTSNDGTTVSPTYVSMLGLIGFIVLGLIWLFTLQRSLTARAAVRTCLRNSDFAAIVARNSWSSSCCFSGTNAG